MEDAAYMNSLVGDYLASVNPQLAKKFKKESKASPLPPGSPNLAELVKEFQKTSPAKRKLSLSNGHTPAKKAKKAESSSDDDSEDSGLQVEAAPVAAKPAAEPMEEDSSSSDDSSDEEEEKSKEKAKPAAKAAAKKEESSSDDSDSDEEEEKVKPAVTPVVKAPAKKAESSSDDSSSDDEEEKSKPAVAPAVKAPAKKEESSSDDSSSDDEEEEAKPTKKPQAKAPAKKEESSSDDSDSDDEEEEAKPTKKPAVKAPAKKEESSSDDSDSDDEEEEAKPATKKKELEPEPELVIKNNKKTADTPQKGGHNKSFNGQPEGKKIFVHNVSEEATYEDFQASVETFGECTDFFNPGRGFAFIEFSTNEEAAACIAGMDNTEVAGRTIQMNIAKPKGEKGGDRGSQGGRGGHNKSFNGQPEGSKIFVHNVSEEATYEDFQASVEKFGEVTDFFNPGRGFAFVEFSTPAEANACIAGMDNTEISGRTIQMNIARPKGEKGGDRGGQGGGRGGRGGAGGGGGRRNDVEGAKLFVHNVSEETSQDDLRYAFESHGTVTDAYNPGKGFAFIQYSSPDEAQAAIKAMNGTHVCGRDIECNIAKPRGEKGGDRGGRGGRGGGRGGQGGRGGGRMGSGGNGISIGSGTGANKKKTFD